MATYFDISETDDLLLIHSSVRDHEELSRVASAVESEIINRYRERNVRGSDYYQYYGSTTSSPFVTTDGKYVIWLDGYREDADDALTDTRLKDALRRTVADVVSHRLRYYDEEQGISSFTQGRVSISYAGGTRNNLWPANWSHRLTEFILNPAYS